MVQANELRIGNILNVINRVAIVITVDHIKSISEGDTDYSAIPLTPEWLERCGFKDDGPHDGGEHSWRHPDLTVGFDGKCFYFYDDNDCIYVAACKYLHQLQNFYFACEGDELQIKMP